MKLSRRIYKLAESVTAGDTVADIGTDHGYVPMLLMREGRSPRVIMSDISEDSLAKAKETFALAGLSGKVSAGDFRVGDGLETIKAGEVDEVIIAGLGGHTITDILAADEEKSFSFKRLILQPRKHSGTLRYYLCTHGWEIESESLAPEGKFACEIITAIPAVMPAAGPTDGPSGDPVDGPSGDPVDGPFGDPDSLPCEDDIRWKYPPAIVEADYDLAKMRIDWKIGSIEEQIANLEKAGSPNSELIKRLRSDLSYLKDLIFHPEQGNR